MGIFRNPPDPFIGGKQPLDARKGVNPSTLSRVVDQPPRRGGLLAVGALAVVLCSWIPGPPGPYASGMPYGKPKLNPSLLNRVVDQPPRFEPSTVRWDAPTWGAQRAPRLVPITQAIVADNPPPFVSKFVWREADTWRAQSAPKFVPETSIIVPEFVSQSAAWIYGVVAAWNVPEPLPELPGKLPPSLLNNRVDQPPPFTSKAVRWPVESWGAQQAPGFTVGIDNPPITRIDLRSTFVWQPLSWGAQKAPYSIQPFIPPAGDPPPPFSLAIFYESIGLQWEPYALPTLPGLLNPTFLDNPFWPPKKLDFVDTHDGFKKKKRRPDWEREKEQRAELVEQIRVALEGPQATDVVEAIKPFVEKKHRKSTYFAPPPLKIDKLEESKKTLAAIQSAYDAAVAAADDDDEAILLLMG